MDKLQKTTVKHSKKIELAILAKKNVLLREDE